MKEMVRCNRCTFWFMEESTGPDGECRFNCPQVVLMERRISQPGVTRGIVGPSPTIVQVATGFFPRTRPDIFCGRGIEKDGSRVFRGDPPQEACE
jgi:hypothetical protein